MKGSSIISDQGLEFSVDDYVEMLEKYAPQLKKQDDGQRIKISLFACHGGAENDTGENSFAVKLSQALDKIGIPAEILGRTDAMDRTTEAMLVGSVQFQKNCHV